MIASASATSNQATNQLHEQYLDLLPQIETHGKIYFRHLRCPHRRADAVQEMRALAWRWLVRLAQQGKDAREFPATFCTLLGRAVRCGRRLCGMQKGKDIMNPLAQQRHQFKVERLPTATACPHDALYGTVDGQEQHDLYEERLHDNMVTPVPEQVIFRVDWPRFLKGLTPRDRKLALFLSLGNSGKHAAEKFGLTPGRVTQLRQQWCREWQVFQDPDTFSAKACLA